MKNQVQMHDYVVINHHTGRLMGAVRAVSIEAAKSMAHILFGCYATAKLP